MRISDWSSDVCSSDLFWGMRMEFTYEEAELISAALPDDAGCIEPAAEGAAGHSAAEHGAASAHDAPVAGGSDGQGDERQETLGQEAFNRIRDAITAVFGKGSDDASATPALSEDGPPSPQPRSEEHTSELQSLMRHSYAVFCLKK